MTLLQILYQYRSAYFEGLLVTLRLCAFAWSVGLIIGGALAFSAERSPKLIGRPVYVLGRIVEAVPILVMLFWLHYPLQAELGVVIDPFITTGALLAALNALAVCGILRRAVDNVPADLIEVARVCGITPNRAFWKLQLPLALRAALGPLTSSQVAVLQMSIFGGLISVGELFRVSLRINAEIYQPVEVYTGLGLFFLAVCVPLNLLARHFDSRRQW